jgi:hypothetical protein
VLLGTPLGTPLGGGASREHDENILGTHWEQGRKTKKITPHPQKEKNKIKNRAHHECMLRLPIGCMKFVFPKNCWSPFLAWANTAIINWGYLFYYLLVSIRTGTWGGD